MKLFQLQKIYLLLYSPSKTKVIYSLELQEQPVCCRAIASQMKITKQATFRSPLQSSGLRSHRSSSQDTDKGRELLMASNELRHSVVHLQTLEHRLEALDKKERQLARKAEESYQRQKKRDEAAKRVEEVRP
jgi:hypothetical protein